MNVQTVSKLVTDNPDLQAKMQQDPVATLQVMAVSSPALVSDKWNYRITIGGITLALLLSVVGAILLAFYGKTAPESIVAIGSGAISALALLLRPQMEKS